ncbi:MAG: hypothetical protein IPH18_04815 [Chitinophagaceae bacterium]|nr:hypothetical protein [Chitinophagaceae bacterium]MBK8953762.1 hypothetical protein [Chitinophagaceae bacterium]
MEQGWDPQIKNFFKKILNSISFGLMWMIGCAVAGIWFELGYTGGTRPVILVAGFYVAALITLILLLRYLIRTWRNG